MARATAACPWSATSIGRLLFALFLVACCFVPAVQAAAAAAAAPDDIDSIDYADSEFDSEAQGAALVRSSSAVVRSLQSSAQCADMAAQTFPDGDGVKRDCAWLAQSDHHQRRV